MSIQLALRKIEPLNPHEIHMSWSDDSAYSVPYVELRYLCPCASCVDEHTGQRVIDRASIPAEIRPVGVEPVGRYALQFRWSDGHASGIYPYERLHEICLKSGKSLM